MIELVTLFRPVQQKQRTIITQNVVSTGSWLRLIPAKYETTAQSRALLPSLALVVRSSRPLTPLTPSGANPYCCVGATALIGLLMPSTNITIDNVSPLIRYDPMDDWRPGSSEESSEMNKYLHGTFATTNTSGARATFHVDGTAIYVYGGKRDNHGLYTVELDGNPTGVSYSGYSGHWEYQTLLFAAQNLSTNTIHFIVITNREDKYLDIDYITWTTSVGNVTTIQDTDPAFTYMGEWVDGDVLTNPTLYSDGKAHQTQDENGYAHINFSGHAISLYGVVGAGSGAYNVQLDAGDIESFNATNWGQTQGKVMLYHADHLNDNGSRDGTHSLLLSNGPKWDVKNQNLTIDYAVVYTRTVDSVGDDDSSSKLSKGAVAGIAAACAGALVIFGLVVFFVVRRRRKMNRQHGVWGSSDPVSASNLLIQPFEHTPSGEGRVKERVESATEQGPTELSRLPKALMAAKRAAGDAVHEAGRVIAGRSGRPLIARRRIAQGSDTATRPYTPADLSLPQGASSFDSRLHMPSSGPATRDMEPERQLTVDDREEDFGPLPLPPDYEQATRTVNRP